MTSISFIRSAVVALLLSVSASIIYLSIATLSDNALAIRTTISIVTLGYVLYLLSKTDVTFGKFSFISVYLVCICALLFASPALIDYALFHVGFIWLVRTVYYHNNFLYALIDLAFSVVSFTAALGATLQSQSVFMSFWCFFLGQALILPVLHYFFSKSSSSKQAMRTPDTQPEQSFYRAHRTAQNALRRLAANS